MKERQRSSATDPEYIKGQVHQSEKAPVGKAFNELKRVFDAGSVRMPLFRLALANHA
jgi:hypothetical protein